MVANSTHKERQLEQDRKTGSTNHDWDKEDSKQTKRQDDTRHGHVACLLWLLEESVPKEGE